ncbi:MAG: hypothetical protein EOO91_21150 [Pedobacter sp.]|nr:MAG: hypothetical protein EOO91_21150 [Pedobacter sp.]
MMIICAFLVLGCGSLNKHKLFSKHITKETLASEIEETLKVQRSINIRDSSDNNLEFIIWPKGPFTFSPSTGFVGEAFKMEVKRKQARLLELSELTTANKQATTRLKQAKEAVVKQKEKKVEWEGKSYGLGVLVLAIAVGLWLVWKRLKLGLGIGG